VAEVIHHRQVRGSGGSSDDERNYGLANLASLCNQCHGEIHLHPEDSYATGFLVHSWESPADRPLLLGSNHVFLQLTQDGELITFKTQELF
jgi:hypothetical protein